MFLNFELSAISRDIFSNFLVTTTVILVYRETYEQFKIPTEEKTLRGFLSERGKSEKQTQKTVNSHGGLS